MKFAHEYESTLKLEGYPPHWVKSAISYRQLKKCIKKIQLELAEMGLDSETLRNLWQTINDSDAGTDSFQYRFEEKDCTSEPKLVVRVRSEDGIPVDASLAPETRAYLQSLILPVKKPIRVDQCSSDSDRLSMAKSNSTDGDHGFVDLQKSCDDDSSATPLQRIMYHRVEVPLRNDNEFFHMLTVGISELNALQADEKAELTRDISSLGLEIAKIAAPSRSLSKTDLYAWRDIFSLYAECQVFFSTSEQDSFTRNTKMADKQLLTFYNKLRNLKFAQAFRKKESCLALNQFLQINTTLLRNLKFQELNMMAMTKILKKFDKRTALGAREAFSGLNIAEAFSSSEMAKAVCFEISAELLAVVPQVNDYLCPVCFNIAFKPIRLRCDHVFCIRCMLVMQRAKEDHCPMCRGSVIMQADSTNLDPALMNFLEKYFPLEVKLKQKENERNLAVDRYGTGYDKCALM